MKTIKTQIREKIISNLSNLFFDNKKVKVFSDIEHDLEADDLPFLLINFSGSTSNTDTFGYPSNIETTLNLTIEAAVSSKKDLTLKLEKFDADIRTALIGTEEKKYLGSVNNIVTGLNILSDDLESLDEISLNARAIIYNIEITYNSLENEFYTEI